jgi:hypothetical protein
MKLIETYLKTKKVEYFGIELEIETRFNYLAADYDGSLYAYVNEPRLNTVLTDSWVSNERSYEHIAEVDLEGVDPKDTMRKV